MHLLIVLNSKDLETEWNALRLARKGLEKGDEVTVFMMGPGVEAPSHRGSGFDAAGLLEKFSKEGGNLRACGTCLKSRSLQGTESCPASNLDELHALIAGADKVLSF